MSFELLDDELRGSGNLFEIRLLLRWLPVQRGCCRFGRWNVYAHRSRPNSFVCMFAVDARNRANRVERELKIQIE